MGRELLHKGDKIDGRFQYEVESVSGQGASCVVYKARYSDDEKQSHLVQIKEFYPYNLSICREQNSHNLICTDTEQFESEKCRFIDKAKKLASLNNDETTNSGTPSQVEIFELNNTAYSVVAYDAGNIYNEEDLQTMDLTKLLEIIKNLARTVELLHKNGYVHLDIKPENFLVDNTDHSTLFDVDSVVLCDEINTEKAHNISYTKRWAAPEVKQSTSKTISYAADMFSIGVILFEAIMGREFLPMETVSYNRDWDIESSVKLREEKQNRKVNINPKFYHKIREILEKTLDRNPSKRFNSAQELYDNLDKARDLLKNNPWIIPSFRTVTPQFTGRKSELSKMNSILQKENTVFLHGFGGIGKSELSLKYAEVYKDDFDTVVFCKYEDSIEDALLNVEIANHENDGNTKHLQKIKELCDGRTLIILDNFDVETDEDDYLDKFISSYRCKKIITTRTDFSEAYTQLEVDTLGTEEVISLFEKESKWIPKTEDEEKSLNEILKLIGYHTYFTVILAKKKEMFSLSIDALKKQTEEMLLKKSGKVTVAKDGNLTTATIDAIAEKLFDFNSITESQKQTLYNLYMLSWRTVSRNDYTKIAGYGMSDEAKIELIDALNDLTRLGWVSYDETSDDFSLHQIMQEMVKKHCKEADNYANNVLEYYLESRQFIKKVADEERNLRKEAAKQKRLPHIRFDDKKHYVSSKRADEIIFFSGRLFSVSKNIGIILEFLGKEIDFFDKKAKVFRELIKNINEYCCSHECPLEIQLKWMKFIAVVSFSPSEIDPEYARLCVSWYEKSGICKESSLDTKKEYWSLVKKYIARDKNYLFEEGAWPEEIKLNEYELKLIDCVEEIKDVLNEQEISCFEVFKKDEIYAEALECYGGEHRDEIFWKYVDLINNSTFEQKEIEKDINSEKDLTKTDKEVLLLLITIKQNGFVVIRQKILTNSEFNDEEKGDKLYLLSIANRWAIENYLEKQENDNLVDYGNFLISCEEESLKLLRTSLDRFSSFGSLLLGICFTNKENFKEVLDEDFLVYFLKYFKKEDLLDTRFWKKVCNTFADFRIINVIFPFVFESINTLLDESKTKEFKEFFETDIDEFSFLKLLKTLSHQVYVETKDQHYFKMEKEYAKKIQELPDFKEELDYKIKE